MVPALMHCESPLGVVIVQACLLSEFQLLCGKPNHLFLTEVLVELSLMQLAKRLQDAGIVEIFNAQIAGSKVSLSIFPMGAL